MAKDFARLRSFAIKEYKFQQDKVSPLGDQGQCLNLTLMWIREQIDARDAFGWNENAGQRIFMPDPGALGNEHARNHDAYRYAMGLPQQNRPNCEHIALHLGLTRRRQLEPDNVIEAFNDAEYNIALTRLAESLPLGAAVLIPIDLEGDDTTSHAVAMFKSGPRALRFFGSSCGVYRLDNSEEFINDWVAVYCDMGLKISPSDTGESPFAVYN